ncbi:leucine-rich repeat domain-containing protein [Rickettsia endosymbiont of Urophora cardui]|uniref:hypothetical protein n=1 Tax=Rickettsia endosymbiont of Urophora cardui TaxID=3066265 RepID=UPI00313E9D61
MVFYEDIQEQEVHHHLFTVRNNNTVMVNRHIGNKGLKCFIEHAQDDHYISTLYLDSNGLTSQDMQGLVTWLREHMAITNINLYNNNITDVGLYYLLKGLDNHYAMTSLVLSNTGITNYGIKYLVDWLKTHSVEQLRIDVNDINDQGLKYLFNGLECQHLIKLIDLHNTNITVQGIRYLADWIDTHRFVQEIHLTGHDELSCQLLNNMSTPHTNIEAFCHESQWSRTKRSDLKLKNILIIRDDDNMKDCEYGKSSSAAGIIKPLDYGIMNWIIDTISYIKNISTHHIEQLKIWWIKDDNTVVDTPSYNNENLVAINKHNVLSNNLLWIGSKIEQISNPCIDNHQASNVVNTMHYDLLTQPGNLLLGYLFLSKKCGGKEYDTIEEIRDKDSLDCEYVQRLVYNHYIPSIEKNVEDAELMGCVA